MAELITPRSAGVRDELLSKVANHAGLRDEVLATLLGVSELDKLLPVTGFSSRDGLLAAKKVNLEREYEGVDGSLLPALATLVRKSKCLETLDFRWHEFGAHTGWEDFGAALTETTSLTQLNLDGTGLGDDGASAIALGLAANRSVSALWLRINGIGDPGAIALGDAMSTCRLELLWLWTNNVGDAGRARSLAGCRRARPCASSTSPNAMWAMRARSLPQRLPGRRRHLKISCSTRTPLATRV